MVKIKTSFTALPKTFDCTMLWAACCTGFSGSLRCAEFLLSDNASFDSSLHLYLADFQLIRSTVKRSKTDQLCSGSAMVLGAIGTTLCSIASLLGYLNAQGGTSSPLFIHQDGTPLCRKWFAAKVQQALSAVGVPRAPFNGHSCRIGVAAMASAAAIPETVIKTPRRWWCMVYQRYIYIHLPAEELAQIAPQLESQALANGSKSC